MTAHRIDQLVKIFNSKKDSTETLGVFLAREIKETDLIKSKVEDLEKEECRLKSNYEKSKKQIKDDLVAIQKSCPHHFTTYYPDPSGNNDSYRSCDICHVEV